MSRQDRAAANWKNLLSAALDREEQWHGGPSGPGEDFPAFVPSSLGQDSNIESIINVANEIQDEDPHVARIICEHAYTLAHNLDPNSVGRGVLQFKTGLMSLINQKRGKKEGERLDRSQDYKLVKDFYISYKRKHNIKELEKKHEDWKKYGRPEDPNVKERSILLKKGYNVLKVLKDVQEALEHEYGYSETDGDIELKKTMESDAAKIEDFGAYNILPLDAPGISDVILLKREVKAAMAAMECNNELPSMPEDFHLQYQRQIDIFDVLEYIFVFQKDNIKNQREHLVLLLANAQSRMLDGISDQNLQLDQSAIEQVVDKKVLANYYQWCQYLQKKPVCDDKSTSKKLKLILVALYLLIWGEAGNVRFLPEGICYLFHQMALEFLTIAQGRVVYRAKSYKSENGSFLSEIIQPFYDAMKLEVQNNNGGKSPHSAWRNYDDFNEFFWGTSCFELGWPLQLDAAFFSKPKISETGRGKQARIGKTNFVEHRSFLHLYHSFHRFWIFFALMFQGLIIFAFSNGINTTTLRNLLSLGPAYLAMKFLESVLDVMFMYGAYRNSKTLAISRIFIRFMLFGGLSSLVTYLYIILLQQNEAVNSSLFRVFLWALGIYIIFHLLVSLLMHIPSFRGLSNKCDNWRVLRFFKWINEEHYYVGRGLYENTSDYMKYMLFWIVVLGCKFTFSYFVMIQPLVPATRAVIGATDIVYEWHDFVSKNNRNALTVAAIWSPVAMIYFLDISVWYTVFSAIVGGFIGAKERLGEIHSLEVLRKRYQKFPDAFVSRLQHTGTNRRIRSNFQEQQNIIISKDQSNAARFAPYWNETIRYLREEDFINNKEQYLLHMPPNKEKFALVHSMVQWPLFLLASKIHVAIGLAAEYKDDNEHDLWEKIKKDEFMCLAVQEAYYAVETVLTDLLQGGAQNWAKALFAYVKNSYDDGKFVASFQMKNFHLLVAKITDLTKILICDETEDRVARARKILNVLYDTVTHDVISSDSRRKYDSGMQDLAEARKKGNLFSTLIWPGMDKRDQIKRLHKLLKMKTSATNVPINLEARRRLQFFANSLFMDMPEAPLVKTMLSFCVFTPYYKEDVLYKVEALQKKNEDGISTLFYLQNIYRDEWSNFLERVNQKHETFEGKVKDEGLEKQFQLWASCRGQTLARTVRGMMYYQKALMLQSTLEQDNFGDTEENQEGAGEISNERNRDLARAQADLKFTYVVTCQIYGQQKRDNNQNAHDILYLMKQYKALRVAFIDTVETLKDHKLNTEYYSKLVKADENDKDQEIYSIKLPGNPILGEGKPENQNHAIIFTRGEAIQTIDMNQDNYFEETLKMRNLLQEFVDKRGHGLRPPTILGVREHVFTGSISSLAWFMSNQETSFVTLGQRVLATPLKVRMHYGHPDVFDRVFHLTRGGISKSSKVINISEDIFAGFNSTLRMGNVTHHEYIQVGKGRDVGLNQIAIFEGKVAGGNGEQSLSRDVYRLGQLFDFFRMLSFFISSVGFYVCTMMTTLTVYVFLYGKAYLVLSGVGQALEVTANITDNASLDAAINTQFLLQIGIFTAVPMIMGFILEQGVLKALVSFLTMQLQLASVFFTFSLGTRTHYFGRTILHGGAKYQETGRGFVVTHIKFAENYRLYSRSHFVKAMEIAMLLIVYLAYKSEGSTTMGYILLSFSSWFLALSWLFAPFLFNPSGFEWQKIVSDFDDWSNWLLYKGGVGVKGEKSWEAWWEAEQLHIRHLRGKILETILSLRFFIFQYGVVYQLDVTGKSTSLTIYGFSWLVVLGILLIFKVFTLSQKAYVHLQMILRLVQGILFVLIIGGLSVLVAMTSLTVGDVFASTLALIPTGWGLLSIAIAWSSVVKRLGLWKSVRSIARLYDAMMGIIIFVPIAALSWFPFFSTFQSRLLFNQAFSRGLEISKILEGSQPNKES